MDQFEIIQEILRRAVACADSGWTELIVNYHVDDQQSEFGNSFLVPINGVLKEKALPVENSLDSWLRRLRDQLCEGGKQRFSHCKFHVFAYGEYEVTYGYEAVDWDALIFADWNFYPTSRLLRSGIP